MVTILWEHVQESFFSWLYGAKEPGLAGVISCDTGYSILFIPKPKSGAAVSFHGLIRSVEVSL